MDLKKEGVVRFVQLLNRLNAGYHVGEVILAEEDIKVNTTGLTNCSGGSESEAYKDAKKKNPDKEISLIYVPTEEETATLLRSPSM
jgi:D-ribose pyranose/furanose isomerase RbsD